MSGHKHAELMLEYAKDALTNENPWELWEFKHKNENTWDVLRVNPTWAQICEYRRKPVKWSPVGGGWGIDSDGSVGDWATTDGTKEFGAERPTKEQAERAAVEMRRFNRLLALRDELCGGDVVDWSRDDEAKYFLCCNEESKTWYVNGNFVQNNSGIYFTTEEHAQRACDMLNSGEVEL